MCIRDRAGIVSGDVIMAVNGTPVRDARELSRTIGAMAPGAKVKLDVTQKGQERTVDLTLGELPNQREARASIDGDRGQQRSQRSMELGRLGMSVAPASSVAGAGKDGVVVTEVQPSSAAAERGFKEGDVILEVGGKAVSSTADVRDAIQSARSENKNTVLIRVKTGGSSRFVAVPLGRG